MAKTFKYDVRFVITTPEAVKMTDLKAAVQDQVGYVTDTFEGAKVGKVTVSKVE